MKYTPLTDATLTLLTGATGFLGQEILCHWLETQPEQEHLLVIARGKGKGQEGAEKRIYAILRKRFSAEDLAQLEKRITVLDGDVSEEHLGLELEAYRELVGSVDHIIHSAAAVRFDQPLEDARKANLEGTRHTLALAQDAHKAGRQVRFNYVSTAYIAGKRRGVIYEEEFAHSKTFHNTYEQTKYEAELLIRQVMDIIPVTIYRPSIIIGNSRTGATSNFKAFYWPIRAYAMGQLRLIPGIRSCRLDLISVDYVAAAVVYLSRQEQAIGECYHLTAGRDNLVPLHEIRDAAFNFFKVKPPLLIHPAFMKIVEGKIGQLFLNKRALKTLKLGEPYFPYLATRLEYDNKRAAAVLEPVGICTPSIRGFFDQLFRYCVETDWGKHVPTAYTKKAANNDESLVGSV